MVLCSGIICGRAWATICSAANRIWSAACKAMLYPLYYLLMPKHLLSIIYLCRTEVQVWFRLVPAMAHRLHSSSCHLNVQLDDSLLSYTFILLQFQLCIDLLVLGVNSPNITIETFSLLHFCRLLLAIRILLIYILLSYTWVCPYMMY